MSLKALWWDRNGYCVLYKWLQHALFQVPDGVHGESTAEGASSRTRRTGQLGSKQNRSRRYAPSRTRRSAAVLARGPEPADLATTLDQLHDVGARLLRHAAALLLSKVRRWRPVHEVRAADVAIPRRAARAQMSDRIRAAVDGLQRSLVRRKRIAGRERRRDAGESRRDDKEGTHAE